MLNEQLSQQLSRLIEHLSLLREQLFLLNEHLSNFILITRLVAVIESTTNTNYAIFSSSRNNITQIRTAEL